MHESSAHDHQVSPPSTSRDDKQVAGAKWNSSTGLDSIIQSMSGANLADLSSPVEPVVTTPKVLPVVSAPAPAQEVEEAEAETEEVEERREEIAQMQKAIANEPAPSGVLKVSMNNSDISASQPGTKSNLMKKPMSGPPRKITSVAKKLVSKNPNSTDIVLESFEATDRRVAKQSEAVVANSTAAAAPITSAAATVGSSRLAAAYSDSLTAEKEGTSIYRAAPVAPSTLSNKQGSSFSSSSTFAAGASESTAAREKYGNAKGISSDQYFGDPVADARDREARSKLTQLSGSTSISSDMLRGTDDNGDADPWSAGGSNSPALDVSALGRWTQDLIKRIG